MWAELSTGKGTVRRRGEVEDVLDRAAPFFDAAFKADFFTTGLAAGFFFAVVFRGLELGLDMDFCLLVKGQTLDTRKNPNLNQFTYYPQI